MVKLTTVYACGAVHLLVQSHAKSTPIASIDACCRAILAIALIQGSDTSRSNAPGTTMEIEDDPYSRDEVLRFHLEPPKRGRLCPKCGVRVPQFVDLNQADLSRLRNLVIDHQPVLAVKELRSITGCSLPWAKIWVQHEGQAREETRPCPYCAKPLRTPAAQQCRFCLMDWHDPENPQKMHPAQHGLKAT
jgi:hypothetical protein